MLMRIDSACIVTRMFLFRQHLWLRCQQHVYALRIFLRVQHQQPWWAHTNSSIAVWCLWMMIYISILWIR